VVHCRRYAREISRPIDFSTTVEHKMAQWFAANMNGRRVFAPGNASYWMNMYSDTPQFFGCCDQSVRNDAQRIATYVIYSSDGAGDRAGEISTAWLKTYGVAAVGVMPQFFGKPRQFDGVLPEAWRDGDNAIYWVPGSGDSLAHVVDASAVVKRQPVNGLDVEPLQPLLAALDQGTAATMVWRNASAATITAQTVEGQVLFVQQSYDPNWRAIDANSSESLTVAPDALGLMTIQLRRPGTTLVELVYVDGLRGSREDQLTRLAQFAGIALLAAWTFLQRRRERMASKGSG
jgi:hypothetical protein